MKEISDLKFNKETLFELLYNLNMYDYFTILKQLDREEQTLEIKHIKQELENEFIKKIHKHNALNSPKKEDNVFNLEMMFSFLPYYFELPKEDKLILLSKILTKISRYDDRFFYFNYLLSDLLTQYEVSYEHMKQLFGKDFSDIISSKYALKLVSDTNSYEYISEIMSMYYQRLIKNSMYAYNMTYKEVLKERLNFNVTLEPTIHNPINSKHYRSVYKEVLNFLNSLPRHLKNSYDIDILINDIDLEHYYYYIPNSKLMKQEVRESLLQLKQYKRESQTEVNVKIQDKAFLLKNVDRRIIPDFYNDYRDDTLSILRLFCSSKEMKDFLTNHFNSQPSYLGYKDYVSNHSDCNVEEAVCFKYSRITHKLPL